MRKFLLLLLFSTTLFAGIAGHGLPDNSCIPGTPGYREIVNFEEYIGYYVDQHTGEKTATTWGKIHYSKN